MDKIDTYMKEIKGDIYNIEEELIGIVTTKERNIFSRKNYILVSDDIKVGKYGYIANISSKELKGNNSYVKVRSIIHLKMEMLFL